MWETRPSARTTRPLTHIASAYLHVPVLGQLAPAQLPLGDVLKPGPLEAVSLDTAIRGRPFREEALECSARDPNHAAVFADLDPELYGLPLGIPSGTLWGVKNIGRSPVARRAAVFSIRSKQGTQPRGRRLGFYLGPAFLKGNAGSAPGIGDAL